MDWIESKSEDPKFLLQWYQFRADNTKSDKVKDEFHYGQMYGELKYIHHIMDVVKIAQDLNYPEDIQAACALHDILEDTKGTYTQLKDEFGREIAEIVYAVTDELGRNRKERKAKTYPKIKENEKAVIVKLCDRIANIQNCINTNNSDLLRMYRKEQKEFLGLFNETQTTTLTAWSKLNSLID